MNPTHLVRAKLVGQLPIHEFGERFADPLYHALQARGYGDITGGDGQNDAADPRLAWISIDIRLVNLDDALEFTRRTLQSLGAPPGSELAYTLDSRTVTQSIDDPPSV